MRALSRLADVAGFWTLDRTTITGRSAVILRQHTTPFRPMFVPFDDLELVYQQVRAAMSTLLVLQTTESAVTEIFVLGVKPKLVMPPKRRAIILLSKARTNGECWATTAANASAAGPVSRG